jgi:hypothetical protein
MIEDLERELTAAMADDVAELSPPQLDLNRMHRSPARRLVVPGAVVAVAVAAAAPLAAAKTGVLSHPASSNHTLPPNPVGTIAPPTELPTVTLPPPPSGKPSLPAPPSVSLPSVPSKIPVTCTIKHRAFRSDERLAALRQLRAAVDELAATGLGAGRARQVAALSPAELDRFLPRAGVTISYYDCLPGLPSAAQRAAAIAEVRKAVAQAQTAVTAARVALEQALRSHQLPSWLGDLQITVVSQTDQRVVVKISFPTSHLPGQHAAGSIIVTIRTADRSIVSIDTSGLTLPPGIPTVPTHSLPPVPLPAPPSLPVPGLPPTGRR